MKVKASHSAAHTFLGKRVKIWGGGGRGVGMGMMTTKLLYETPEKNKQICKTPAFHSSPWNEARGEEAMGGLFPGPVGSWRGPSPRRVPTRMDGVQRERRQRRRSRWGRARSCAPSRCSVLRARSINWETCCLLGKENCSEFVR